MKSMTNKKGWIKEWMRGVYKSSNKRTNKRINIRTNIRTNKSVKHTKNDEYKVFKNLPETINCHPNPGAGQYSQGNIQLTQRFQ